MFTVTRHAIAGSEICSNFLAWLPPMNFKRKRFDEKKFAARRVRGSEFLTKKIFRQNDSLYHFSNFFSKNVTFTKFSPKCETKSQQFSQCVSEISTLLLPYHSHKKMYRVINLQSVVDLLLKTVFSRHFV